MSSFDIEKMVGTVDQLGTAFDILLGYKDREVGPEISVACEELNNLIMSFDDQISILRDGLIRQKNAHQSLFKRQLDEFKTIVNRSNHMIDYAQLKTNLESQQYNKNHETKEYERNNSHPMADISMSPIPKRDGAYSLLEITKNYQPTRMSNGTIMSNSMMGQSSRSQAAKQVLDIPLLKSVNNDEMDTVPKYIKGRSTSLNVNIVIDGINIALENKYEILQKPRTVLKSKDLVMYKKWTLQQKDVGQGKYFVTADDISSFGEIKVDGTTLDIITILRHLKRLKEFRGETFVGYLPILEHLY